jgi:hypothetical protein
VHGQHPEPGEDESPEATQPEQRGDRHEADDRHGRDTQSGDDHGNGQRHLDTPQDLALAQAHAPGGLDDLRGYTTDARDDVSHEHEDRVGDEGDDRRGVPESGERREQREQGE